MEGAVRARRGAPFKGEPGARQRILATAVELFYQDGIRAVGVDTVAARSGVSKTSLYRIFESTDALIAAAMQDHDDRFWQLWEGLERQGQDGPKAMILSVLRDFARRIAHPRFRGCPFLNVMTEFPDSSHPGRVIALANKNAVRARFTELLERAGVIQAAEVSAQLMLLVNGALATGQGSALADLERDLLDAAEKLMV